MKLGKKIIELGHAIGKVENDAKNAHQGYGYISSNKMVALLRDKLPKYGIAIIPSIDEYKEEPISTRSGTAIRTVVKMTFTIYDVESDEKISVTFYGADQDSAGKSMAQAITECTKRFYFKLFNISTLEDVDPDSKTAEPPVNDRIDKMISAFAELNIGETVLEGYLKHDVKSSTKGELDGLSKIYKAIKDGKNPMEIFNIQQG